MLDTIIKRAIEGLILGIFTVVMIFMVMRLALPDSFLKTCSQQIPNLDFNGVASVLIVYVVVTILIGTAIEFLAGFFKKTTK